MGCKYMFVAYITWFNTSIIKHLSLIRHRLDIQLK